MPTLIDINGLIDDRWVRLDDCEKSEEGMFVIGSLAQLKSQHEYLRKANVEIGIELEPDAEVEDVLFCLPELKLIVLQFEVFSDGRAFSQAKLLRERYDYTGDIRAVGDVIRDQLAFMQRCGFNEFQISEDEDGELALQAFDQIAYGYQPDLIGSALHR